MPIFAGTMQLHLPTNKNIYFASDQHFGAPNYDASRRREKQFLQWLESIEKQAYAVFLLGDLFDFWFEYRKVVPKGFVRTLGKLAQMKDNGVLIYAFAGNHDLWMKDYFLTELGIPVFHQPQRIQIGKKIFLLGHGDGLGPGDKGYKRMKKVFVNPLSKFLFRWLHPDLGVSLAQYLSLRNRLISGEENVQFQGVQNEWLVQYCQEKLVSQHYDYFIFGHRHLPLKISVGKNALYLNTGDWIHHNTYGVFNGQVLKLEKWESKND